MCVREKMELNNIKKNTKMPQCIQMIFDQNYYFFLFLKLDKPSLFLDDFLDFVTSQWRRPAERCEGWWLVCVVEVRIFIGTIHLRDDEKYRKVLECFKRRVVHLSNTQQERYARRILAFNALLFFFLFFSFFYLFRRPF